VARLSRKTSRLGQNRVMNHLTSEFSEINAHLRALLRRTVSPGAIGAAEADFDGLALALFTLQFAGNAPYRRFCEARGAFPKTVQSWMEIPAVPAAAFKEWELTSLSPERRTVVFHSSGTTEQRPSRHFHSPESLALYECSLVSWFAAHFAKSDCIFLTPPPAEAPHSSLVHMFATIRREFASPESYFTGELLRDGSWDLDLQKTELVLHQAIAKNRPLNLLGTARSVLFTCSITLRRSKCV